MSDPLVAPRKTVARPATIRGVTLFTAVEAVFTIRPAESGGLRFISTAAPGCPIPATVAHAVDEPRRTVLVGSAAGASPQKAMTSAAHAPAPPSVQTVEHVLSALSAFGITDAILELAGPEIPIGDGSALPFTDALAAAGLTDLDAEPLAPLCPATALRIDEAGASVEVTPRETPGCSFTYHLDYGPDAPFPPQHARFTLRPGGDPRQYIREVAPARTFSTLPEVLAFRKMGLFAHLEPSQMLVLGPDGPIENTLRFPDEPARHKLLDLIGDLALAGRPIQADIVARRSGHALNRRAAAALAAC